MKKELVNIPEIKLIGLSVRTNNKNEMNPQTSKIGTLAGQYWSQNVAAHILNRINPNVTLSVYTEYDSNEHGDYTYFIGEEVSSFSNTSIELRQLTISPAKYQKFTTTSGTMPAVVIDAWQKIWKMTFADFEGQRAYKADFEIYDQRAIDPENSIVDICIGLKD